MRCTIYIARHGETDWNRAGRFQGQTDTPLNAEGRKQATALAQTLLPRGILRVHTSDLARAYETAYIVGSALGTGPVVIDSGLRERRYGCFEGLTREECERTYPDEWAKYLVNPADGPGGSEPHASVHARIHDAVLRAVGALPAGGAALLIGHGAAIRIWATAVTGRRPPPVANADALGFAFDAGAFEHVETLSGATG